MIPLVLLVLFHHYIFLKKIFKTKVVNGLEETYIEDKSGCHQSLTVKQLIR